MDTEVSDGLNVTAEEFAYSNDRIAQPSDRRNKTLHIIYRRMATMRKNMATQLSLFKTIREKILSWPENNCEDLIREMLPTVLLLIETLINLKGERLNYMQKPDDNLNTRKRDN